MKLIIRSILINVASLHFSIILIPGFSNTGGVKALITATLVLALMNLLIRPFISLLFLPINLVTLGAFRWLINVAVLFLLTLVVSQIKINPFTFTGFSYQGFVIPPIYISKFWTIVLASAALSFSNSFLFWVSTNE